MGRPGPAACTSKPSTKAWERLSRCMMSSSPYDRPCRASFDWLCGSLVHRRSCILLLFGLLGGGPIATAKQPAKELHRPLFGPWPTATRPYLTSLPPLPCLTALLPCYRPSRKSRAIAPELAGAGRCSTAGPKLQRRAMLCILDHVQLHTRRAENVHKRTQVCRENFDACVDPLVIDESSFI